MSENSYGGPTEAEEFSEQAEPLFEEPARTVSQGFEHEPPFAPAEPADESTEFGSSEGWGGTDLPEDDGSWEWDGPTSDADSSRTNAPRARPRSTGRPSESPFQKGSFPGWPKAGETRTRSWVMSSIFQLVAPRAKMSPTRDS